ncbi:hypothetical protein GOV06_05815 [Candidatus Woesearchaeota archaeon]|nr:hypothetical protein [Candidatus Woesearchaeota archaeon]
MPRIITDRGLESHLREDVKIESRGVTFIGELDSGIDSTGREIEDKRPFVRTKGRGFYGSGPNVDYYLRNDDIITIKNSIDLTYRKYTYKRD